MNNELIHQISSDLKILRYQHETEVDFAKRVLYSAMSVWIKVIMLDNFEVQSNNPHRVSKHHVYKRGREVLEHLLSFYPELYDWFYEDYDSFKEETHPIHIIRKRMLLAGEIIETGFDSELSLPIFKSIPVNGELVRILGIDESLKPQYSGLSCFCYNKNNTDAFDFSKQANSSNWAEEYLKNVKWQIDVIQTEKEYFNPLVKTDTIFNCWETKAPANGLVVSRIAIPSRQYLYYIEKIENGVVLSQKIDDYLIKSRELVRILFLFRKKVNNPVKAMLKNYSDCFMIRLFAYLPTLEKSIIESFGWPVKNFSGELNWIYHTYLYETIKTILHNLHIEIEENNHE